MLLHPQIFNGNAALASETLGIARSTLLGWVSTNVKKNSVAKWFDIVKNLTWGEVKKNYKPEFVAQFGEVDEIKKLKLSKFRELRGDCVVLSRFCSVPPAKRAKLAKKTGSAVARGEASIFGFFTIVNKKDKMQTRGRHIKYPEMTKKIIDYIMVGWHSGAPVSRQGCYMKCREWAIKGTSFYGQYLDPARDSSNQQLCH